jgi:predicted nucleic acid-binding protein
VTKPKIALDSNILSYAEGINDPERQKLAHDCLAQLDFAEVAIPIQALGELYRILVRKGGYTRNLARGFVTQWRDLSRPLETNHAAFQAAMDLAAEHHFQIWDAIVLSVCAENGCACLLSEDMQAGFVWRGVEIINPLTTAGVARLQAILG